MVHCTPPPCPLPFSHLISPPQDHNSTPSKFQLARTARISTHPLYLHTCSFPFSKIQTMAKLSVTVIATVTLFLFSFTLSHARTPLNLPGNDVINREVQNSLPESDVTPAIHLSSEEASTDGPGVDSNSNSVTVTSMPIKFVKFHPINRHVFTLRSTLPFRRCRGRRFHRKFRPLGHRVEIPYGNDMIQSSSENSGFDPMSFHGGVRQEPPRWITIPNDHHHHHYHHHHHVEDVEIENSAKLVKESEEIGLFDRFQKFLNQFEF